MAVTTVQFANSELEVISIKDDSGQLWMLANPFARILEYSNAPNAISTYVRVENQKYFEEIRSARYGQTCVIMRFKQSQSLSIAPACSN
uniref:Baculovirus repeated ORF b n=1 Tax=Helicoverpa armigera nucleopolyhedrovirus TaxID=51313 RepID=A0A0E3JB82_9ABAC|nr:baculovirus repeated ORF b [Helicoverpa armigera nucleopolyhedrovirus]